MHKRTQKRVITSFTLTAFIFAAALFLVVTEFSELTASIASLSEVNSQLIAFALLCVLAAPFVAASSFKALSFTAIPYARIAVVQLAGLFINRLLPWGAGNISLFVYFLHKNKHTYPQAAAVVALNNIVGFVGHLLVMVIIYSVLGLALPDFITRINPVILLAIGCALVIVWLARPRNNVLKRIANFAKNTVRTIVKMKDKKASLAVALLCNIANTLLQLMAFYLVLQAFDANISFSEASVIFTGGIAAIAATPTPGGIGGAELGLAAGFVAYGVPAAESLTLALGYRLVTYWLPLVAGIAATAYARKRAYI